MLNAVMYFLVNSLCSLIVLSNSQAAPSVSGKILMCSALAQAALQTFTTRKHMNDNVMGLPGSRPENLSHIIQVRAGDNYLPFVNCQWRMETEESLKEELKESRKSVGWLVLLWMPIKI